MDEQEEARRMGGVVGNPSPGVADGGHAIKRLEEACLIVRVRANQDFGWEFQV